MLDLDFEQWISPEFESTSSGSLQNFHVTDMLTSKRMKIKMFHTKGYLSHCHHQQHNTPPPFKSTQTEVLVLTSY